MKELLICLLSTFVISCNLKSANNLEPLNELEVDAETFLDIKECPNQINGNMVLKESISNLETKVNVFESTDEVFYYLENPEAKGILDFLPCNLPENFKSKGESVKVSLSIYEYRCKQGESCYDSRFLTAVLENIDSN